jgi:type I restriction enzyme S subunit
LFRHFSIPAFDENKSPKTERGEDIKSLKLRVPAGVILLSKLNPEIERVWLADVEATDRAVCSTEFLVLRPRSPYGLSYAYCLARSAFFRQQIKALVTGTSKSHQRAHADTILGLTVVRPPVSIVDAFDKAARTLLDRTLEIRRQSRTLAALCDTLLPKLISGELRVKDSEKFISGAV